MVSININKILDSKWTGLAVFGATGVAKMASDYKNAPDSNKNFVLLRDSLILGGSAVGVGAYQLATSKMLCKKNIGKVFKTTKNILTAPIKKTNFYKNKIKPVSDKYNDVKKSLGESVVQIIHACTSNTAMLASGIAGAVGADYAIQYSHIEKNKRLKKLSQRNDMAFNHLYNYENTLKNSFVNSRFNKEFEQAVGSDIKTNVYSRITDMPAMRMFSGTMVGIQGFEVIEQKTFKNRMRQATKCLVSNSVIPLFFLSTASCLTRKMNPILRIPLTFGALVGGTMYTNKLINNYECSHKKRKSTEKQEPVEEKQNIEEVTSEQNKQENIIPEENNQTVISVNTQNNEIESDNVSKNEEVES